LGRKVLLSLVVLVFIFIPTSNGIPTGQGQQLFFDNFSTSQLSPNWNPVVLGIGGNTASVTGNLSQAGGWLGLTVPRVLLNPSCGTTCFGFNSIMANAAAPISGGGTPIPSLDNTNTAACTTGSSCVVTISTGQASDFLVLLLNPQACPFCGGSMPTINSVGGSSDAGWSTRQACTTVAFDAQNRPASNICEYTSSKASAGTDTITVSTTSLNSNQAVYAQVLAVAGANSFDGGGPQIATGSSTFASVGITTNTIPQLRFGFITAGCFCTFTAGSGYVLQPQPISGTATETGGFTSGGTSTVTMSLSPSSPWGILGDAIDAPNGGGGSSPQPGQTGFFFMVWRMVPFNLTQVGNSPGSNSARRDAAVTFGIFNNVASKGNGIGIQLTEVDGISDSNSLAPNSQREAIALLINHPQIGVTTNCFASFLSVLSPFSPTGCSNAYSSILYSEPNSLIDLNTIHQFTLEMNLVTGGNSWVAMQVDSNGWYNVTQSACSCIEGVGDTFQALYPYIMNSYAVNNIGSNVPTPNQSLGTLVNYVLVNNYVPSSLPSGSTPPINPVNNPLAIPPSNNPLFSPFGNIDPSGLWQYYANVIGNGVPVNTGNFLMSPFYFGGAVLYVLSILMILGVLYFMPDSRGSRITSPFMLGMFMFFDTVANFFMGTLEWWIFATMAIFMIAIMVGTVPSVIGKNEGFGL